MMAWPSRKGVYTQFRTGPFQLTVYDPGFQTPQWLQDANVYQIFPDRFRNSNPANDYCTSGNTTGCPLFYGDQDILVRSPWNTLIGDPRTTGSYFNEYGTQFYGGDLAGITAKLDYLKSAGFDTLYLTPIFDGSSNHRYDTDNYLAIDPALGTLADFQALIAGMNARGMRLILDGVFNHTSSDSLYFDRYGRYGTDGACESLTSQYRSWFEFLNNDIPCGTGDYTGWFGYDSLAVLQDGSNAVRNFIYRNSNSVVLTWYNRGVDGWRFDVADEISHNWWRDFRAQVKGNNNGPLIGEVWPDASAFLLGDQLDSVMNYRFRKNVLGFVRGVGWIDNDNNGNNEIIGLTPSQFDRALKSVREDYPPQATAAMLNLLDSHDTNRALYTLTLQGDSGLTQAKQRLQLAALFQFTYVGAPMVYYGDEVGIDSPSLANHETNGPEDDPYNRAPYPWADEAGDTDVYGPVDANVLATYTVLGNLRQSREALRSGAFKTLLTGDTTVSGSDNNTYAFARVGGLETAIVALNNGGGSNTAVIPVTPHYSNGAVLENKLTGTDYTVSGGAVTLTLPARTGAVLLPIIPANLTVVKNVTGGTATASWAFNGPNGAFTLPAVGGSISFTVTPGSYTLSETPVANWTAAVTCTSGETGAASLALGLSDGEAVTCTFTNTYNPPDTEAPETTIDDAPDNPTTANSAHFAFSSDETGSTFDCSLDGAAFTPCASTQDYSGLSDGSHAFAVRATDAANNTDATPASHTWVIDTTAPDTTLLTTPPSLMADNNPSFTFESDDTTSTFECSLDGAAFAPCTSPQGYNDVADGVHSFEVRAVDPLGNTDATPASYTWTVDTTAPNTTITSSPSNPATTNSGTFEYQSSEGGTDFECNLKNTGWVACDGGQFNFGGLTDGPHTFAVRAIDAAGHTDPTPDDYNWVIDTVGPTVTIGNAPLILSNSPAATFEFSTETGATTECRLDGGPWEPCTSPQTYTGLSDGDHTFEVRATDTNNLVGPVANYPWTIDTVGPMVTITAAPPNPSNSADATFVFTTESGATTECQLDGGAWAACVSPQAYTSLSDGSHTFEVRATDAAGNTSPVTSHTWAIDTAAPTATITNAPPDPSNSVNATFEFTTETGATTECQLDNGGWTACDGPESYTGLTDGSHAFEVRATDAAGNVGPADTHTWTIDTTIHAFTGFYSPVDNPPTLNTIKAGSAIPVKFSLGGDHGLDIFAAGYPSSRPVSCSTGDGTDPIEQIVNAGNSGLQYDSQTGIYTYVWKTTKSWTGCRELVVRFDDGTQATALFKFR